MRFPAAGEKGLTISIPGLEIELVTKGFPMPKLPLPACGVMWIVSSSSVRPINISASEISLSESESIILILPAELDIPCLSGFPIVDHNEFAVLPGEPGTLEPLPFGMLFRGGIIMPLPEMTGDESGEDCSASVE